MVGVTNSSTYFLEILPTCSLNYLTGRSCRRDRTRHSRQRATAIEPVGSPDAVKGDPTLYLSFALGDRVNYDRSINGTTVVRGEPKCLLFFAVSDPFMYDRVRTVDRLNSSGHVEPFRR